ncbi:alpha/beta hydrolase [Bacillus sp. NTK071]|uniref:alpha/beta fold hydrolase n=1 Tax=Bacillus sp. NTK071 TaxID=2802175 RepID=UPI001A8F3CFD|nr:alpha/beta hydrolase [Bacillus sp. NTK071]MBN8209119.1 alpha/beta hydrolase [Bacillus sp. NTK071]
MKEFDIKVFGKNVHGVKWGDAANPHVLCLHGLTNNALGFNEMAEFLKKDFHLMSIDLPGHGKTTGFNDEQSYFYDSMSDWVHNFVSCVSNSPVYILGHSWGAAIALHYSKRYPHMVNGIVMLDGGYVELSDDPSTTLEDLLEEMSEWVNGNQFSSIKEYEDKKRVEIGRWSSAIEQMVHADMTIENNQVRMKASEETVRAIMKAMYMNPFREVLSEVDAPVYLLRATQPPEAEAIRSEGADLLRAELKGDCRISAIPETGHVLHWQKPVEVNQEVKNWLIAQTTYQVDVHNPR